MGRRKGNKRVLDLLIKFDALKKETEEITLEMHRFAETVKEPATDADFAHMHSLHKRRMAKVPELDAIKNRLRSIDSLEIG